MVTSAGPVVATPVGIQRIGKDGKWEAVKDTGGTNSLAAQPGILLAGGGNSRILVSTDVGVSWKPAEPGLPASKKPVGALLADPANPARFYAAVADTGIFVSDDGGKNWTPTSADKAKWNALAAGPAGTLYALAPDRLLKSTDSGASWTRLNPPGKNFTAIAIDPAAPDTILVGSMKAGNGIRTSIDGGLTWTEERVGNEKIETILFPGNGQPALCGSSDRGLFRRVPDGKNDWSRIEENPDHPGLRQTVRVLAADPKSPGKIYAFGSGAGNTSSPDQYVDGLALDYSQPPAAADLVVLARSHGNNVTNLWNGREGASFMRRQTGTSGNEHYNWIARLKAADGAFVNSTWFVGLDPSSKNFGSPYEDPNLAGWPDHNRGNANLKGANGRGLRVGPGGRVSVAGTTRGAITTATAFQKMTSPLEGIAPWHDFLRIHAPDLSTVAYATALTGEAWDPATGAGAENTRIAAAEPLPGDRILAVGWHTGEGPNIPTANPPAWGKTAPAGRTMMLALLPVPAEDSGN